MTDPGPGFDDAEHNGTAYLAANAGPARPWSPRDGAPLPWSARSPSPGTQADGLPLTATQPVGSPPSRSSPVRPRPTRTGPGPARTGPRTARTGLRTARAEYRRPPRWLTGLAWVGLPVGLFLCYLRVSQTRAGDYYGSVFTLQGWSMLHGNLLLHGWSLSDASFYTTELPEYLLVDLARGLSPDAVHIAAAITYTLLLVLVALLARGRARGREALAAMLIGAGIMCSPQLGSGVFVLLGAPDHLGTCVPVLLAWLLLDRGPRRWYVPAGVGVILAWALVADSVVILTGVLPLVAVAGARLYRGVIQQRKPLRSRWFDIALIAAGLAATGAAAAALSLIRASGGFSVHPVPLLLTPVSQIPGHVLLCVQEVFLVFGADFFGQHLGLTPALLVLHVVGLALAAWATCLAVRRLGRGLDLVSQLLAAGIVINLAGFLMWAGLGTDITVARELIAVLPFAAVLAGRLLTGRLIAARALPALSAVLCGYLVSLAVVAAHPVASPQYQQLTTWLTRHHFGYGLSQANLDSLVDVSSGQRVRLAPVLADNHFLVPGRWETDASWFSPRLHDATYLVQYQAHPALATARGTFGPPLRSYRVGPYTILVWRQNLLSDLH